MWWLHEPLSRASGPLEKPGQRPALISKSRDFFAPLKEAACPRPWPAASAAFPVRPGGVRRERAVTHPKVGALGFHSAHVSGSMQVRCRARPRSSAILHRFDLRNATTDGRPAGPGSCGPQGTSGCAQGARDGGKRRTGRGITRRRAAHVTGEPAGGCAHHHLHDGRLLLLLVRGPGIIYIV